MTSRHPLTPAEIELPMVEIEKSAELAGHEPNDDNLDRCRRILLGELTLEAAHAEIEAKCRQEPATGI